MSRSVFSIVGARPQFIKAAVLSRAIRHFPALTETIVHSGQHFDENMSDVFFKELGIPAPGFQLDVRACGHGAMTGRMLEAIEALLLQEQPDIVVVFGDTNTTLAGALAAAKLGIPVAHVEAGMRAYKPIPEEINRVLTDHISALLFTVNGRSTASLRKEGIAGSKVIEAGDVMYDCALMWSELARRHSAILDQFSLKPSSYALCTAHRAGNTDDPERLNVLVNGLNRIAKTIPVVMPVHPRTRQAMERLGLLAVEMPGLRLIDPVGYLDMARLELGAALVLTDSGGVQREAFFHGVPCVTFRDETEWPELTDAGWNELVPLDNAERFADAAIARIGTRGKPVAEFGDGNAAGRIARGLVEF